MNKQTWFVVFCLLTYKVPSMMAAEVPPPPASNVPINLSDPGLGISADVTLMEEGKALYENGQLIAALGKFMTVLRKDPRNPEARQYLRMIIDIMRQNPAISASKMGTREQAVATNPLVQEEIRKMLQLRSRLTMDLKAIPMVQVDVRTNVNQVWIDTSLLFEENSGGLKEQGVPVLDRAAAWLRTYGQQPVIIHCYPEEFQDASANGSLFLRRYSELFNFFVEERKLPAQRFVSADLLKTPDGGVPHASVLVSTSTSHIVIETIGTQSAMLDSMPSMTPGRALSQWLENSIVPSRKIFNPEEGEWVTLDLSALSRNGLRTWTFTIVPSEGKNPDPVFRIEGKGNLLKRLSWDGHNQKTGDFVRAGSYVAKLLAINTDATVKSQEEILQVERTTKEEPVVVAKPRPKVVKKPKAKKPAPKVVEIVKGPSAASSTSSPAVAGRGSMDLPAGRQVPSSETAGNDDKGVPAPTASDSDSLIGSGATSAAPVSKPSASAAAPEESGDSVHAIWKQVIQFEPNQSALMPTVKSSLERIGKTLEVYPLQKVRITGFAMTSETNSADLANKRADVVRSILVNEYHVDAKRVLIAGGKTTTSENASKVEMSITN